MQISDTASLMSVNCDGLLLAAIAIPYRAVTGPNVLSIINLY